MGLVYNVCEYHMLRFIQDFLVERYARNYLGGGGGLYESCSYCTTAQVHTTLSNFLL